MISGVVPHTLVCTKQLLPYRAASIRRILLGVDLVGDCCYQLPA